MLQRICDHCSKPIPPGSSSSEKYVSIEADMEVREDYHEACGDIISRRTGELLHSGVRRITIERRWW